MRRIIVVAILPIVLVLPLARVGHAAEPEPQNLLRLATARLDETTVPPAGRDGLAALTDGDAGTVAQATALGEAVDLVYGFDGAVVTPEQLVVTLPAGVPPESSPARVEVLVSTLSAQAGFVALRADPLQATDQPQQFEFPPTAAGWIMLRFTPAQPGGGIAIAEAEVRGREGPPATRYAFKESPAKAFDVLKRLKESSSLDLTISEDESKLFVDAADGKLDQWSFAEAALLASGVLDAAQRKAYLRRIDALEAQAKKAIAGAKTPLEKGERLLAWLHSEKGPLAKGYVSDQTDLSAILDSNTFNCVSSAVMYNVLGRRLGLDLRAIEVPDHAFSILYVGTRHADVETTTEAGFNPARDQAAQQQFEAQTGFRYIPDQHRDQRREVGEAGLAAIIYYNHGVTLTRDKRHHEALLAYFRAMSLDSQFDSAVKNALAALANWSGELADEGKFEAAVNVVSTGLELAPTDATLLHNRIAVWTAWAQAMGQAGQDDEALAILRRAADEVPDGDFVARQAWIYLSRGEKLVDEGRWQEAMAAVEPGLEKVDAGPREELQQWRAGVRLRWANAELAAGRYESAVDILRAAMDAEPDDNRFAGNLVYTVQQWAGDVLNKSGEEEAKAVLQAQLERFPDLPELNEVAEGHVYRVAKGLMEAGDYKAALAAVDRQQDLLEDQDKTKELLLMVYDGWASKHSDDKQWDQAVDVYAKGLEQLPDDERLKQNLVYTIQEWARDLLADGGAEQAQAVLLAEIERFPEIAEIGEVAVGHAHRAVRALVDAGEFDKALECVEKHRELLKDADAVEKLAWSVYDGWADSLSDKKEWQEVIDVYTRALAAYPGDRHLENNAIATWDAWARTFFPKKDWTAAIQVYEQALAQFPDDGTLKNNLNYCRQQKKKQ